MRAIIVNSKDRTITETDIDGSLKSLQQIVGGMIEAVSQGLDDNHHCYVNEEGLLNDPQYFFMFRDTSVRLNGGRKPRKPRLAWVWAVIKGGVDLNEMGPPVLLFRGMFPERPMYTGKTLFAQLMDFLPWTSFARIVERYGGDRYAKSLRCAEHFRVMAFAQLSYRESLRDIEACLSAQASKLYHMGFREPIRRSTLSDANEARDWRIYADFAQVLIRQARKLYAAESFGVELSETVYALNSTTIDLCLSVFPWAPFRATKAAVKMHTLLDLRGAIPSFIHVSDGKLHDVKVLDRLIPEAGAIYVMDRGYLDFERLYVLHQAGAFFVTRAKSNLDARRLYSAPTDRTTGIICDQTIALNGHYSQQHYPDHLRRVRLKDADSAKTLVFLSNQFALPATTICALYKARWQVELFFKWVKQHLRIKRFYGTSENAVKSQIWIAVSVYVLVAIVRKRLNLETSLYTLLQILSVTLFEKMRLYQAVAGVEYKPNDDAQCNQLNLFAF